VLEAAFAVLVRAAGRLHNAVQAQKRTYNELSHCVSLSSSVRIRKRAVAARATRIKRLIARAGCSGQEAPGLDHHT
jgi:hypothetical protein